MQRNLVVLLVAALLLAGAAVGVAADKPAGKPQTTCPVSGKAIEPKTSPHLDWEGQRIYFADKAAADAFRNDPDTYFAKFEKEGIELENIQTTCPVSGEKLDEGDMGKPVSISYKGRTVRFCCNMCPPKFQKEPAKYLAKLPGEQPAAR
jgi:YHS domain-containing protein